MSTPSGLDTILRLDPKEEGTRMSEIMYPLTQCNIPEGQYLQKENYSGYGNITTNIAQ